MKDSFTLAYPHRIIFGEASMNQLSRQIPEKSRILLVCGKSFLSSSKYHELMATLDSFHVKTFSGVPPEPPIESVDEIAESARNENASALIAIGGGSVIDAAKTAAALASLDGKCHDYFHGGKIIPGRRIFLAALPTTAGTGAEITMNSVLSDYSKNIKKSIRSIHILPDLAIVDPLLTISCPPALTAYSGLDALTQAIESFTSADANPVSRSIAKSAVGKIFRHLPQSFKNGQDLCARKETAMGSLLSAMAFSQSGLGAVHGIAHPLGAILKIPHGLACSILLPVILEWNSAVSSNDYRELAEECGLGSSDEFISALRALSRQMSVPRDFAGFNIQEKHIAFIVANCRSRSMDCNPIRMSDEDIEKILRGLK